MKRNRASQGNDEDINGNKKVSGSTNKRMKADDRDAIASLMRKAAKSSSIDATTFYEKAGNLANSLEDEVGTRRAFIELGDAYSSLAESGMIKTKRLEFYKKSLSSFGKAVSSCQNLHPGPTARSVQGSVFRVIAQVVEFVKTIECEKTRNICLEQAVRAMEMSGKHWLELVCMAKSRLAQAEMLNDMAVVAISDKKFKEGIYLLSEMYRPLELTRESMGKLENNGKMVVPVVKEMQADLAIIRTEYQTHTAMAQGLQALDIAEEMVEDALRGREEMSVDLVWDALDMLKQAALVSGDVEVEANARGKMGLIYLNILKLEDIAKAYLSNAMDLVKTLTMENMVNLYSFHWYAEVAQAWNELQDEVLKREEDIWAKEKEPLLQDKEVKRSLKLIEGMEINDVEESAEFLFEYFEPDHLKEKVTFEAFKKEATTKGFINDPKKMLMKLIVHWHPDKVNKETEENKKWYIICEEITKKLTAKYSLMKC